MWQARFKVKPKSICSATIVLISTLTGIVKSHLLDVFEMTWNQSLDAPLFKTKSQLELVANSVQQEATSWQFELKKLEMNGSRNDWLKQEQPVRKPSVGQMRIPIQKPWASVPWLSNMGRKVLLHFRSRSCDPPLLNPHFQNQFRDGFAAFGWPSPSLSLMPEAF